MNTSRLVAAVVLILGSGLWLYVTHAQQPGIRRVDVVRHDLNVPGRELIQVRVEFDEDASFGKHSHPGAEIAYVLEGTLQYRLEDQPPLTVEAGEAVFIPAGTVHSAENVGTGNAAELATYIVEKGKPLVVLGK